MDESKCDQMYDSIQQELRELHTKIKGARNSVSVREVDNLDKQMTLWNNIASSLLKVKKARKTKLDC
jgi:hypothetical protein